MLLIPAKKLLQLACVVAGTVVMCLPAFSQLNLGRILGVVTDPSGAVIADAVVTVTDVQRGVSRNLTTDQAGEYNAPSLTPGQYSVHVAANGFQGLDRQNIVVGVGQEVRVDVTLMPGAQTQVVTVTGVIPNVNTTSAVLSTALEAQPLEELPIASRLYTHLLDYQVGVFSKPGDNSPAYSVNGLGTDANQWMLDGVEDVNMFEDSGPIMGAGTSNDELTMIPLDSIQEVNIMADAPAQFGWNQGGVVNVGLKSGTNDIHGTAYAFGRDSALDAQNTFLPKSGPKSDDYFEQYGGSIGGPIKKNKIFYFANYERMVYTIGSPQTVAVPTASSLNTAGSAFESFPDAVTALEANGVTPSPLSLALAGCALAGKAATCDPTKGIFGYGGANPNNIPTALDNTGATNNFIGKIDYHPNDKNAINGDYFFGQARTISNGSGVQPYWANVNYNRVQTVRLVSIYTPNANWVNEARFAYDRYNLIDGNGDCAGSGVPFPNYAQSFGFVSGLTPPPNDCGFPNLTIGSFNQLGAAGVLNDQLSFENTLHFVDTVSYTRGKHQLKFGGEFHHTQLDGYQTSTDPDGAIDFLGGVAYGASVACTVCSTGGPSSPLEDFMAGIPTDGSALVNPKPTVLPENRFAAFIQDDFRIKPRLTLNLGLRYEYLPALAEVSNYFANFDPNSPTGMIQQTNGNPLYSSPKDNFGPRVGFNWDIFGTGTTVLRGGFGIMYGTFGMGDYLSNHAAYLNTMPTGYGLYNLAAQQINPNAGKPGTILSGTSSLGLGQVNWAQNVPVFTAGSNALNCGPAGTIAPGGFKVNPCNISYVPSLLKRPMMYSWNLAVQRAITNNLSLTVGYVGNHDTDLGTYINVNQPTLGPSATMAAREPYHNQFPWFNQILEFAEVGVDNYNALQVSLVQRTSHGLTFNAYYTYNRSIGTSGGGTQATPLEDSTNLGQAYANNPLPFQHVGVTATYQVPKVKAPAQLLEGWEVNGTLSWIGSTPYSVVDTTDFAGIGNHTGLLRRGPGTYWTLYGSSGNFNNFGYRAPTPCAAVKGSNFAAASYGCTVVPTFSALPQVCQTAANQEPANPNVKGSSGVASVTKYGCWLSPNGQSAIVPPALGTFGDMAPNALTQVPFKEIDFSVTKTWHFTERLRAQFRAEFFNVLNSSLYAGPTGGPRSPIFGQATSEPITSNPITGTAGPRTIQLGLKFLF